MFKPTALALLIVVSVAPAAALAKGGTPQNHHCMKDGAELTGKTKKECKKEGGTWDKLPAGEGAAAAPADADKAKKAPEKATP